MKRYFWLILIGLLLVGTTAALAASVTPTVIPGAQQGGKNCSDLLPGSSEVKIEPVPDGTYGKSDGMLSVTIVKPSTLSPSYNSFDWTSNIPVAGVVVKNGDDGANWYYYGTRMGDTYLTTPNNGAKAISHISFCYYPVQYKPLVVTKTAAGTYDRTVTWDLTKTVDDNAHSGFAGQTAGSSLWTVVADKNETPGNYKVTGTITVNNPNAFAVPFSVSDTLNDGTAATVTCPAYSAPAGGSVTCSYTATPAGTTATLNTAVVTPGNTNIPTATATAPIGWTPKLIGYDSGTLSDARVDYSELISADTTKTFPETFVCPADASLYINGSYSFTETNTAVLNSNIGKQASATVAVECTLPALKVEKTAAGTYDRIVEWTLTKSVSPTSLSGTAGQTFLPNPAWTVDAVKSVVFNNYLVSGTITISNPAAVDQSFTVQDVLDDSTMATVSCDPAAVIPAGGVATCTYLARPSDASATLNTATVSALGNADQSATAPISWTVIPVGYESATLLDERFEYSKDISDTYREVFVEPYSCPTDVTLYKNGVYEFTVTNTARLNGDIGLEASAQLPISCTLPALTVSKDAAGTYVRTVTWTLDKSVDNATLSGTAGMDAGSSTWKVVATKLEALSGFNVTGTITIHNPASIPQTFTLLDTLNDGTVATVTCPTDTVPAGGTVVCTYTASPAGQASRNNVAVKAVGNDAQTARATIAWQETLVGYDSGTLKDARFGYEEIISGNTTKEFPETFTCPADVNLYKDGKYSFDVINEAVLNGNINLSDSAKVTVECTLPALNVVKTADGTYDRTVTWKLTKTVDPRRLRGWAGQDIAPVTWTVFADKTEVLSNYKVTGTITITNPAAVDQSFTVQDVLDDGTLVTVSCEPAAVIPAGGSAACSYTAAPIDASATLNTATVTAPGNADQIATAEIQWKDTLIGFDEGTLLDERFGYNETITGDTEVKFSETFTCSSDPAAYTNGQYSRTETNTAVLDSGIGLSATAQIPITCVLHPLNVKKTAAGTYDRTVTWDLTKVVDQQTLSGTAGQTFDPVTWTVVADKTEAWSNFLVTGMIYVYNPAAIEQTFAISDFVNGTEALVSCDTLTLAPAAKATCSYSAAPGAWVESNTATVTATGNPPQSGTAAIQWTDTLYGYDSGTLGDARFNYSEAISGDTTKTFDETFSCPADAALYTDGKHSFTATNTAILNGNIGLEASASVKVECVLPALQVMKDAAATYERTITWTLDKSVDDNYHEALFGQFAGASIWTVVADKTEVIGNYQVIGTITITNPAGIPQTFTISDMLNDGTVAAVTCPMNTVPAGGQVACTYVALPAGATATSNTAQVTAAGNPVQNAYADFTFAEITIGFDSGTLRDPRFGFEQVINSDTAVTFPEDFTCPSDPKMYINGVYTAVIFNYAYLNGNIGLEDSASVKMKCYWNGRTPGYWKNHTKAGQWPAGYLPNQPVLAYFSVPQSLQTATSSGWILDLNGDKKNDTLLDALSYRGGSTLAGKAQILLRAATAALLNEAFFGDAYPPYASVSELIAAVNATLATQDGAAYISMASMLDWFNNGVH